MMPYYPWWGYPFSYGWGWGGWYPPYPREWEIAFLEEQERWLEEQLRWVRDRLAQLRKEERL